MKNQPFKFSRHGPAWLGLALLLPGAVRAQVKNPGAFVYAIVGDIDTLDPHWQYDGVSSFAAEQVYEGLIGYSGTRVDAFEPKLSERVPTRENGLISADGRVYRFPLRKGVLFHDGTPMIPEDARYSLLRSLLMNREAGHAWMLLEPILGLPSTRGPHGKPLPGVYEKAAAAVRVEDGALVIRLPKPFAPFLSILPTYGAIVSKKAAIAAGDWDGRAETWAAHNNPPKESTAFYRQGNGTGPFRVERWDPSAKQLTLARHPMYWRAPAGLERVVIRTVDEFGTRRLLLQGGDADAIFMDRSFLPQVERLPGVKAVDDLPLLEVHNSFLFTFRIDTAGNPYAGSGKLDGAGIPGDFFADKTIRRAFAHAFPYEEYLRDVYRGKGARARGPIPRGVLGHNAAQPVYPFDPKAAEALFRQARGGQVWESGFRFACIYQQGKETRGQACRILKAVVERMNPRFRVDVHGLEWSRYLELHRARKLPLVNARWGLDYPDPHNPVYAYLHSAGTYAEQQGYKNPALDRLIEAAVRETAPAKRAELYRRVQAIAHEDCPQIYTIDTADLRVYRDWITGFDYNPVMMYGYLYPVRKG